MFNKPSEKINLNSPDPNSDIYISEGERFNKDFAAYDYNRRNIEHERKKEMYQNRKNILLKKMELLFLIFLLVLYCSLAYHSFF